MDLVGRITAALKLSLRLSLSFQERETNKQRII